MIDDNALAAAALERRFKSMAAPRWLGWTPDPAAAVSLVAERAPSVVLLDVEIPGADCFALLRRITTECRGVAVVMFSGHDQPALVERALAEGASGYIHKDEPTALIADLLIRAAHGECVLSPLAARAYMHPIDRRA
jgi:two-component system nitrate/nitrite response regulator NarL